MGRFFQAGGAVAGALLSFAVVASAQVVATKTDSQPAPTPPPLERVISLRLQQVTLESALGEIARQSGIQLLYSRTFVPLSKRVSVEGKRLTVGEALRLALQGTGIVASMGSSGAVILEAGPKHESAKQGQPGTLMGRVTDTRSHEGVGKAEVFLEKTQWRTTTDTAGRYRLAGVDSGRYTLTVRQLGYKKQSRLVAVHEAQEDTVDIALEPVALPLDELVTTATGQQRRRDLGNAITTIRADSVLQNAPIRNLTDLLENRVPGLTVQHTTGAPGDPSKLRLRGLGSALRSNDPIVIVDGVRVYAAESEARSGNLTNALRPTVKTGTRAGDTLVMATAPAPSPLDQIDPNIIEKIEVFKGPSAATLYGADAANGVIVVTTKRGRPGPTRWDANVTLGRTMQPGQWPTGYYRWGHAVDQVGEVRFCPIVITACVQDSLVQFQALNDPALTLLGKGHRTSLSLTASGGTQALTYSLTGTYSNEIGLLTLPTYEAERFQTAFNRAPPDWMQRPHHYDQWNVTSNIRARLGASAELTWQTSLARSEQQRTSLENQLAPLVGTYVDTVNGVYYRPTVSHVANNSTLNIFGDYYSATTASDVLRDYYTLQTASALTFTTGLNAQWHPRPWFNASSQAGLNVVPRNDQLLLPAGLVLASDSGAAVHGTGRSLVGTFNVQGELRKPLGWGFMFVTSVGANLTRTTTNDLVSSAGGLVRGTSSITGADRVNAQETETNASVYGWYIEPRVAGQRLSLSLGLRLDGSNTYGTRLTTNGAQGSGGFLGKLLGLPKLNGSWVISEEPWFPFNRIFSSLRLRGAYGQAHVQPGPADRLRLYTRSVAVDGEELDLTTLGNTQLRPERSTEFEGGFDADLLDSRISVELTAYRKLQVDALMNMTLPSSVNGGGSQLVNIGNIRNRGLELTVGMTPLRTSLLTWSAQVNYTRNTNTVVKLGDGVVPNKNTGLVEGYPLYSRWARPILGFADQSGDGVLQPSEIQVGDSLVYMGRLQPAYQMAASTNLVLLGGKIGVAATMSYDGGATQVNQSYRQNWVLAQALVDPAVPLSEQAAILATTRVTDPTDYGLVQEFSTFRLSALSVRYRAPAAVARLLRAQQVAVAVQGANLALHTTYQGKDPNVNVWSPGEAVVDTGQLPQPRTWQFRVDLNY